MPLTSAHSIARRLRAVRAARPTEAVAPASAEPAQGQPGSDVTVNARPGTAQPSANSPASPPRTRPPTAFRARAIPSASRSPREPVSGDGGQRGCRVDADRVDHGPSRGVVGEARASATAALYRASPPCSAPAAGLGNAEVRGIDHVLDDRPVTDLPNGGRGGGCHLVQGRPRHARPAPMCRAAAAPPPAPVRAPGSDTPTNWCDGRAGLANGPSTLKIVGMPSSLRTGPANLHGGMEHRREAERDARALQTRAPAPPASGPTESPAPRRRPPSRTSKTPRGFRASPPVCPVAATTIAAMLDRFTVPAESPPVPQVSTAAVAPGKGCGVPQHGVDEDRDLLSVPPPWPAARSGRPRSERGERCRPSPGPWTSSARSADRSRPAMRSESTAGHVWATGAEVVISEG